MILVIIFFSYFIAAIRNPSTVLASISSLIFPIIFLSFPWWIIYLQSASYDQKGNIYHAPISGLIDDTGVLINGQNIKTTILWTAYTRYKIGQGLVLLYQGKSCFNIFVSAMFSNEEDWKQFVDELNIKFSAH